jgi:precorrin-3B methylase
MYKNEAVLLEFLKKAEWVLSSSAGKEWMAERDELKAQVAAMREELEKANRVVEVAKGIHEVSIISSPAEDFVKIQRIDFVMLKYTLQLLEDEDRQALAALEGGGE